MATAESTSLFSRSTKLHAQALDVFPGGVNSGLRAAEQPVPIAFSHGLGCRVVDVDGNTYLDYQLGQGALLLGHADPGLIETLSRQLSQGTHFAAQSEVELEAGEAIIAAVPSVQRVRFTNSATEAVMAVLRLARAATGRARIVRFEGHYHGWSDEGLAGFSAPKGAWLDSHFSRPSHPSEGVLQQAVDQFIVARFNDVEALGSLSEGDDVAAIIFEPVMCNTGCIAPLPAFVRALDETRSRLGCLLIADETITGVRFGFGGAQTRYGITPDLTILGKAIGGGLPVAAFGGRTDLMELISSGVVGHAGTLNGNPLCMAAVRHIFSRVTEGELQRVEALATTLAASLRHLTQDDPHFAVQQVGPVVYTTISSKSLFADARDIQTHTQPDRWARIRLLLLECGVRVLERGLWYLSLAHQREDIDTTLARVELALAAARVR